MMGTPEQQGLKSLPPECLQHVYGFLDVASRQARGMQQQMEGGTARLPPLPVSSVLGLASGGPLLPAASQLCCCNTHHEC